MKMEENASVSGPKVDSLDDSFNNGMGKEFFWSNINENYALLVSVDLSTLTSPSPPGPASKLKGSALKNELKEALETVSELKKENTMLQNHRRKISDKQLLCKWR